MAEIPPTARTASALYATITDWPSWHVEQYTYLGLVVRHYWTKYKGQAYMLRQDYGADPNPLGDVLCRYEPKISLCMRKGWPRENPVRNWSMHSVADYMLPGVKPGEEAAKEIATFRSHLPELLAEVDANEG